MVSSSRRNLAPIGQIITQLFARFIKIPIEWFTYQNFWFLKISDTVGKNFGSQNSLLTFCRLMVTSERKFNLFFELVGLSSVLQRSLWDWKSNSIWFIRTFMYQIIFLPLLMMVLSQIHYIHYIVVRVYPLLKVCLDQFKWRWTVENKSYIRDLLNQKLKSYYSLVFNWIFQ